jgi:hypothetical protein
MSELPTTKERRREIAKETAHLFYIMANIMVLLGIGSVVIYDNTFTFETGVIIVLLILVDFCITYGLIDIVEPFEKV